MNASSLLNELVIQGFTLKLVGESIEVSGGKLNDQQRQAIRHNKRALCGLLEPQSAGDGYIAAEREAIQREHEASDADIEWPSFDALHRCLSPEGWTVTAWQPPCLATSKTAYYDKLFSDMQSRNPQRIHTIARCKAQCRHCRSDEAYLQVIQDGTAIRRDCAACGKFIDFPTFGNMVPADDDGEKP